MLFHCFIIKASVQEVVFETVDSSPSGSSVINGHYIQGICKCWSISSYLVLFEHINYCPFESELAMFFDGKNSNNVSGKLSVKWTFSAIY